MGLLKPATVGVSAFKVGILGFQGSGKTFTAMLLAYGIAKTISSNKIAFFDTEVASDFFVKDMKEKEVEFFQVKSRSFIDLLATIKECNEAGIKILVIDSVTHLWRELCNSYMKKKGRNALYFQDWKPIKDEWAKFTDEILNSPLHMVICGRAGWEYDYDVDESGHKDLIKIGTKMKAETETGYEPNLVIEMEAIAADVDQLNRITNRQARLSFKPKIGSKIIHRAHVKKDRSDLIDGMVFDNPTFEDFLPHFNALNVDGKHEGIDLERNSESLFPSSGRSEREIYTERVDIALEEIKGVMVQLWSGSSAEEKKSRADFMELAFNTRSWTAITKLDLKTLEGAVAYLPEFKKQFIDTKDLNSSWNKARGEE